MVKPLRNHYAMEGVTSVYDEEALTALELVGRTTAKVNECVEAVNGIPEKIAEDVLKHIEDGAFGEQIFVYCDEVTGEIEKTEKAHEKAMEQHTIDVDNRMSSHMQDVNNRMTSAEQKFTGEVAVLEAELASLLGSIQAGGGTGSMDNEVIDARVTFDGTTKASLGDAIRSQIEMCMKAHPTVVTENVFNNADNAPYNRIMYISTTITAERIANLPVYGTGGLLITFRYKPSYEHGNVQFFINPIEFYYRYEGKVDDQVHWYPWVRLSSNARPGTTNFATGLSPTAHLEIDYQQGILKLTGTGTLWGGHHFVTVSKISPNYVSLDVTKNNTYQVFVRDTQMMIADMADYMPERNDIVIASLHLQTGRKIAKIIWTIDDTLVPDLPMDNLCSIFTRVCCCGDSYTSGNITTDAGRTASNPNFSWPHYLGKLTGNEYINCGVSGANVLTWQNENDGLLKARAVGKCSAYIVGLGINDKGSTNHVDLGDASDIGTNAQTYYGGMSNIIRELAAINPDAHIFLLTMAGLDDTVYAYNNAVKDIAVQMGGTYNVHVLDNSAWRHVYVYGQMVEAHLNNHYTAIGYQVIAETLKRIWSRYLAMNVNLFDDVHRIPVDTTPET